MYRPGDRVLTRIHFDGKPRKGTVVHTTHQYVYVDLDYRFIEGATEVEMRHDEVQLSDDSGGGL
jgi:hypothetical protein